MIPSDFFTGLHIDEASVMARFGGSSMIFEKFLKRFPSDPSWNTLCEAVKNNDLPTVETAAHTLKGVCANFGFSELTNLCSDLVSAVRSNTPERIPDLFACAQTEYQTITAKILEL